MNLPSDVDDDDDDDDKMLQRSSAAAIGVAWSSLVQAVSGRVSLDARLSTGLIGNSTLC